MNYLVKFFTIARNSQAGVLEQVEAKLCRKVGLQEQDWTSLHMYFSMISRVLSNRNMV